jgi:hypothetical protein
LRYEECFTTAAILRLEISAHEAGLALGAGDAILVAAPEDKPWGLHEFTVADIDGNLFRVFYDFATPEREKAAAVQA